jgi:hypothetical protein
MKAVLNGVVTFSDGKSCGMGKALDVAFYDKPQEDCYLLRAANGATANVPSRVVEIVRSSVMIRDDNTVFHPGDLVKPVGCGKESFELVVMGGGRGSYNTSSVFRFWTEQCNMCLCMDWDDHMILLGGPWRMNKMHPSWVDIKPWGQTER